MSANPFTDVTALAEHFCTEMATKKFILLCAYNGSGKSSDERDMLYVDAFIEDVCSPDNELKKDEERLLNGVLKMSGDAA